MLTSVTASGNNLQHPHWRTSMPSTYETKMPSYLAMSRGDLIAEVLSAGEIVHEDMEAVTAALVEEEEPHPESEAVIDARERVRIANGVLRERFNIAIHFYGDYMPEEFSL
jgi:hypothetical protein